MDPMTTLLRFLYLGNDNCIFVSKSDPLTNEMITERLECITTMAEGRPELPFNVIKQVLQSKSLRRTDEAMMALAYCIRRVDGENGIKLRTIVYNSVAELLVNDNDFFLFIKYSNVLGNTTFPHSKGFGRGMKKSITNWYAQKSAIDLANLISKNRGLHNWTHKDIITLAHINFGENNERLEIVKAYFKRGYKVLESYDEQLANGTLSPALNRLCHILRFKICEGTKEAATMISLHNFGLADLPSHLYAEPEIWEVLVPKMTFEELLKIFPTLHDLNLLKPNDELSKKFSLALGNKNLITGSKIHPLTIFGIKKKYENNCRYTEAVKNMWHIKKIVTKRSCVPNPHLVKILSIAVNRSFDSCPKSGARYFITLDLRQGNIRRSVYGMGKINCLEASVILALSVVKRENAVKVYTFTDTKKSLKELNIIDTDSYEKAFSYCKENLIQKTEQSLALPFKYLEKKKFDVFITIVDSVARFCRQGLAPIAEFNNYRRTHKQAKYILINLARHTADLNLKTQKGFLEIVGINPDVPKIIHAFAKNQFS